MEVERLTVCYLEKKDEILMLYRNKKENDINKGKWIGVGGHFEKDETPYECAIREIKEETGYVVNNIFLRGIITFSITNTNIVQQLYVFSSKDFKGEQIDCNEGKLEWIKRKDIMKLNMWETDIFFMKKIIEKDYSFFVIKAVYDENNKLVENKIENF